MKLCWEATGGALKSYVRGSLTVSGNSERVWSVVDLWITGSETK